MSCVFCVLCHRSCVLCVLCFVLCVVSSVFCVVSCLMRLEYWHLCYVSCVVSVAVCVLCLVAYKNFEARSLSIKGTFKVSVNR